MNHERHIANVQMLLLLYFSLPVDFLILNSTASATSISCKWGTVRSKLIWKHLRRLESFSWPERVWQRY